MAKNTTVAKVELSKEEKIVRATEKLADLNLRKIILDGKIAMAQSKLAKLKK